MIQEKTSIHDINESLFTCNTSTNYHESMIYTESSIDTFNSNSVADDPSNNSSDNNYLFGDAIYDGTLYDSASYDNNSIDNILFEGAIFDNIYYDNLNISSEEDTQPEQKILLFTTDAVSVIKRLSPLLEVHFSFHEILENIHPLTIAEFDKCFEQKLAMYISLKNNNHIEEYHITKEDTIFSINELVSLISERALGTFSSNNIKFMLEGYPVKLISDVCNAENKYSYIMGESIKKFIEYRQGNQKWLPNQLIEGTNGNVPLTDHPDSPLTVKELNSLYKYLGSRKSIYVNMLLNSVFEWTQHVKHINSYINIEQTIASICKSSWFYLLLFASIKNRNLTPF
jgi:hypothetical protein